MPIISTRPYPAEIAHSLEQHGLHPVLARIYAARGITRPAQLESELAGLLPFDQLKGIEQTACQLADAIQSNKRLLIVADYDADGATACAVAMRALRQFGATVDYLVPNRFEYGYGLTPEIVRLAAGIAPALSREGEDRSPPLPAGERIEERCKPDILITVDNGIASVAGVAEANRLGMTVLVTDHHLPGDELPAAAAIVNPNQPGCTFPSKNLAGVGVIFYVMLALRAELRKRGAFSKSPPAPFMPSRVLLQSGEQAASGEIPPLLDPSAPPLAKHPEGHKGGWGGFSEPNLARLLDIVALGTVADVVKLDDNNRILVTQGLKRLRAGHACAGLRALFAAAGRDMRRASTYDLGFMLGPRLNAAGRLNDMSLGIECLITDDEARAMEIGRQLDALNRERREIEADMKETAFAALDEMDVADNFSLSLYEPDWHQGVIGILASRIKDKFHRPAIAFAQGNNGELKGSGRSIPGLHLRDALDLVSKRHPDLLLKFGGHAMAAGVTIREQDFARFSEAFEAAAQQLLSPADLERQIETDGLLAAADFSMELATLLEQQVWGQGFPQPAFEDSFTVAQQRIVGEKHLKLKLAKNNQNIDAILFFHNEPLPANIHAVYRLNVNEYNGSRTLQLMIEHWKPTI